MVCYKVESAESLKLMFAVDMDTVALRDVVGLGSVHSDSGI